MPDPEGRSPPAPRSAPRRSRRPPGLFERWLGRPVAEAGGSALVAGGVVDEVDIIDQAEAFGALRVSDVMTPRADISALEIGAPLGEVVRTFVEVEHSRMPIYRETLDDPVGVVHLRDLLKLMAPPIASSPGQTDGTAAVAFSPAWDEPVLRRLRREALYVPASMRAEDLLLRMRAARIHMALVIDEFGGTDGLVTLEDILEALVGDISDEHDLDAEPELIERGGVIELDARTPLEDLEEKLGAALAPDDEEEEIDTVGGLVVALAGHVPQRGEVIRHPDGHEFEVLDADPRRIRRLRVRPATPHSGSPDSGSPHFGSPDSGSPDSGSPDSGSPDSGSPDSGSPGSIAPPPLGGAAPVLPPDDASG